MYLNHEILFEKSHSTINIADANWQDAILEFCETSDIKALFLDNLSCLAPDVDENDPAAWTRYLLNFTLNLRRRGVSVVFIQHSGRSGQMRGHSRREDPANWIIKLTQREVDRGAKFISVFEKNRNASQLPVSTEWWFAPEGVKTLVTTKVADAMTIFEELVESGVDNNADLAEEMGVTKGRISQLAQRAINNGSIKKQGAKYVFVDYTDR
jgi:superfamily I DNA/RNA helicase